MLDMNLQLFAGEGGDGAGEATAEGAAKAAVETVETGSDDKARREEFKKYISDNKDLYEEGLKSQLDRRMKRSAQEIDQLRGEKARYDGLAQALASRYGVDPTDLDGIVKAVDGDSSWLEEQAARNGLTLEQQKHLNALEAENSRYRAVQEAEERQRKADETLKAWRGEEEKLRAIYPDFDLEKEVANNEQFADLLRNHVPMQTAYQVCHMDELMTQGMQYAVQQTADKVSASVRANGLRPQEGAGRSNAPTRMSTDPAKLTREQREELIKRASRGEEITFA